MSLPKAMKADGRLPSTKGSFISMGSARGRSPSTTTTERKKNLTGESGQGANVKESAQVEKKTAKIKIRKGAGPSLSKGPVAIAWRGDRRGVAPGDGGVVI